MCGRLALTTPPDAVRTFFGYIDRPNFPPRFNIAPTQPLAIVRRDHGQRRFHLVRWGLIPSWVKDPSSFTLLINARAETAAEKPSFRAAVRHHRCLVPASGFYEWRRTPDGKQPFWIHPADGDILAFAGLWDTWCDPDGGDIDTGAILTMQSNRMMSEIHHRMPVILKPDAFDDWLDTANVDRREAMKLLQPVEDDFLVATPVSTRVNKVVNDDPDVQRPADPDELVLRHDGRATPKETGRDREDTSQLDLF
ncbi:SOS response-associated peptidase [Roseibium aggregatum]|uniref:Abasic site processing protein n=1 Tax=Roseibium aggregatum TaxID=187304 RepID=A0A939EA87_9HYPH|nr:SOS response-associated peptidase [Roseibium aggregatum]MBN9669213.1 SOS response-associated peptidase [Roseibium aggregatum]